MKLEVGKMATKQLALWFGISYGTFRNNSNKYLEELNYFCDYEKIYGGVMIKEVYISEYVKNLTSKDSEIYLSLVEESGNFLCSVAGMARKLNLLYPDTWGKLSSYAVEKRLRKAGIALFGKTNLQVTENKRKDIVGHMAIKNIAGLLK